MTDKTLVKLYTEHVGKVSDRWSLYLNEYDRILGAYRNNPLRLLEIGMQNGGSLEIWSKYFPHAQKLVGCDINPSCAGLIYEDPRIAVVVGDANSDSTQAKILGCAPAFDVIIDDGSHRSSDIVKSFARYFPHLADGGVFVAEDLHCSYWQKFEGGLFDPFSSITFFKRLADVVNHEHWGIEKNRVDIMRGFFSKYGSYIYEDVLQHVHSVEFINSMCVIRRDDPVRNRLGKRIIVGSVGTVVPGDLLRSSVVEILDQTGNVWTARSMPPDEELLLRIKELADRDRQIASLNQSVADRDRQIASLNQSVAERDGVVSQILASTSWRVTRPLRAIKYFFTRRDRPMNVQETRPSQAYASYIEAMEPKQDELARMKEIQATFGYRPIFSIVVPVYNAEKQWLRRFIESVQSQVYPDWELCIADDCSTASHVRPLLTRYAEADSRIKLVFREKNGHISAATNSALELATGHFMCLMDNDDEIAPNALYEFAHLLNRDAAIDMIYSDEDKLDVHGKRYDPFFKPDWSPEALEGCMYTARFACYRMNIVREVGSFRTGYDGAQDYDFVLRFSERAKKIVHVPKILYHWRAIPGSTAATMDSKDYVLDAAVRALTDRANRMSGGGEVKPGRHPGSWDVRYAIHGSPLVSVIIPSAGRLANVRGESTDLLVNVIRTICEKNTYQNYEIVVVDNDDLRQETIEALSFYRCRFVHFTGEFNVAAKMNMGAKAAHGEYLLFMNDDIEAIAHDWMACMLQLAQRPDIGVVGAKLYFENDKLQHVGIAFWNGLPDHIGREMPGTDAGYFYSSCANRNYLAVTGAVMMSRRSVFEEVGGFDERLAINYNDIDYCLKVYHSGRRVVFAAGAELYHYESLSRERTVAEDEIKLFQDRWRDLVAKDPYFGPYFDNHPPNYLLRNDWLSVITVDPLKSIVLS